MVLFSQNDSEKIKGGQQKSTTQVIIFYSHVKYTQGIVMAPNPLKARF